MEHPERTNEIYNKMEEGQEYTIYSLSKILDYSAPTLHVALLELMSIGKVTVEKRETRCGIGYKYIWKKVK